MSEQTVTRFVNTDTHSQRLEDHAVLGEFVHHYVYPVTEGWYVVTHCHITGGSQNRKFATKRDLDAYLRGFEVN